MREYARYASPLGTLLLAQEGGSLTGLWMEGQKYFPRGPWELGDAPVLDQARSWLDRYFAGERPDPRELPLAPQGSGFQKEVWALLLEIPYGETVCYGELAERLGRERGAARAVGGAVGRNPLSIMIPCHRVLGSGGRLTGYAGGLERKRWLLAHEAARDRSARSE